MNRFARLLPLLCFASTLLASATAVAQVSALTKAERLLLRGNYAESNSAYAALREQYPVPATLGLARGHWQQGQQDQAIAQLDRQLKLSPQSAALHAERALVALHRGKFDLCNKQVQQALTVDSKNVQARWVQAELWRCQGQIPEACDAYQKLAEYYDEHHQQLDSPRKIFWLAQALAQHARFNGDKKRFPQLMNDLYPQILSLEPNFWPAHYQSGLLLLEKFNAKAAETAFDDALQINPQSADGQLGLARIALNEFDLDRAKRHLDRAAKTNPKLPGIFQSRADIEFFSLRPQVARKDLLAALELNPHNVQTLGRLAATYQLLSSPQNNEHQQALKKLIQTVEANTKNLGEFHAAWGAALEQARRFPQAAKQFRDTLAALPELIGTRGRLGKLEMALGHEDVARRWLEESFARDPYNVRVKNQLEVLDLLSDYETIKTEHFIIRYDPKHDRLLGRVVARQAELCYDQLTETFDFELPERAVLEIFHDGRGVKARQWFGARMVGLPNIHTIAACGGNVVAMVSPTAEARSLNWADILRHEIVHLINLQQTNYAAPHWLTEGCAVWAEGRPRRKEWEKLLVRRVPLGKVFDLDSLNLGFIRPRSVEDRQFAYCQAEIYINLIAKKQGVEGVRRLLAAYRDNLSPAEAIVQALKMTQAELETEYNAVLGQLATQLAQRHELQQPSKLAAATEHWEANPEDLGAGAELALVRLRRGDYSGAGRLADKLLAQQPNQPVARLVKAQLLMRIGDDQGAAALLSGVGKIESPPPESLKLLAGIKLRQDKLPEAKRLYQLAADRWPEDLQWTKALAVVAIRQQDTAELNHLLIRIANGEPGNLVVRKKLLQLAKHNKQDQAIQQWANEVLHIDPNNRSAEQALQQTKN